MVRYIGIFDSKILCLLTSFSIKESDEKLRGSIEKWGGAFGGLYTERHKNTSLRCGVVSDKVCKPDIKCLCFLGMRKKEMIFKLHYPFL